MSGFDPGPGWVEVDPESTGRRELHLTDPETGRVVRSWARVEPVPPLPVEPYTVIRVTWRDGGEAGFTLRQDGSWRGANADLAAVDLADRITGFEVLAEPRAVTAKAVLDDIRNAVGAHMGYLDEGILDEVAHDFGVPE